ncbi:MAG: hypothetical protein AB1482_01325 [Pseudomonadota bacterium]
MLSKLPRAGVAGKAGAPDYAEDFADAVRMLTAAEAPPAAA